MGKAQGPEMFCIGSALYRHLSYTVSGSVGSVGHSARGRAAEPAVARGRATKPAARLRSPQLPAVGLRSPRPGCGPRSCPRSGYEARGRAADPAVARGRATKPAAGLRSPQLSAVGLRSPRLGWPEPGHLGALLREIGWLWLWLL
ncbi:unnamed protein product [Boreogadus saida]